VAKRLSHQPLGVKTMDQFLLAFFVFILGVVATILTQYILRRIQFNDAKRKRRLERLSSIKEWMEASRRIFNCKYPDDPDISLAFLINLESNDLFSHKMFTEASAKVIYEILTEYQQSEQELKEAERKGQEALRLLREKTIIHYLKKTLFSRSKNIELLLRSPIQNNIYPHVQIILASEVKLFDIFPTKFRNDIFWQRLKHTDPINVKEIFYTLPRNENDPKSSIENANEYILGESELGKEKFIVRKSRANAINAIDKVIEIINEYEEKWVIPLH
jgi:hypothetical protein